jgi:hypothetical protein
MTRGQNLEDSRTFPFLRLKAEYSFLFGTMSFAVVFLFRRQKRFSKASV